MSSLSMTKYMVETPDVEWEKWKETVPRSYSRLGDRLVELIEADRACHEQYGMGLVEFFEEESRGDDG